MKKQIIALFVFVGSVQLCAQVEVEVGDMGEQENNNESFGTRLAPEQTRAQQITNSQKQQGLGSQVPFVQDAPGPVDEFTDTTGLGPEDITVATQRVVIPADDIVANPTGIEADAAVTNRQAASALDLIVGDVVGNPQVAVNAVGEVVSPQQFSVFKKILKWFADLIKKLKGNNVRLTKGEMRRFVEGEDAVADLIQIIAERDGRAAPKSVSKAAQTVEAVQDQFTVMQEKFSRSSQAMRAQMLADKAQIDQEIADAFGN